MRREGDTLHVEYEHSGASDTEYLSPRILVEFGARSTGQPSIRLPVSCDAARHLPDLEFPTGTPSVMTAERTFWEKATAAHAFCLEERLRGERFARHWYDLVCLDAAGVAQRALLDRALGRTVAHHKAWFFPVKAGAGRPIDYLDAVEGRLRLVPLGPALESLRQDYDRTVEAGLLEEPARRFEDVMDDCRALEERANGPPGPS